MKPHLPAICPLLGLFLATSAISIAATPAGSFKNPKPVPGIPTPSWAEVCPTVTQDELTIIYFAADPNRLYQGRRSSPDQPFAVEPLGPGVNSTTDGLEPVLGPALTADGLVLIFARDPVGGSVWDAPRLYESRRASVDEPFGAAVRLEGGVNQQSAFTPFLSSDGTLLLFSTGGSGSEDIWAATRPSLDEPFGDPVNANDFFPGSQINTPHSEMQPSLSSDGLTLLFGDHIWERPGGSGGPDIWVCTRPDTDSPFSAPINLNDFSLGSAVNTPAWESWPCLSRDWPAQGSKIYYAPSAAIGTWEQIGAQVDADLWEAEWVPYQSLPTQWERIITDPASTPPGRDAQSMVYDERRGVIVMHGGRDASRDFNDTWEFDGESWTRVSTGGPGVHFHSMTYDANRGVIVLFGGRNDAVGIQNVNETWEFDGENWVDRTNVEDPKVVLPVMVYDPTRKKVIRHGGLISGDIINPDPATYEWDGAEWKVFVSDGDHLGPAVGSFYHAGQGKTFTWGTADPSMPVRPNVVDETWAFNGAEWSLVSTQGPPLRNFFATAYDSRRGVGVLFGGLDWNNPQTQTTFSDTWEFNGLEWNQANPQGSPGPLSILSMAYDSKRQRVVLFGGTVDWFNYVGRYRNETWEYGLLPLRITDVSSPDEGRIEVHWVGEAPPYQLQSRDTLSEGDWQNQGEPTDESNATVPADGAARFFRVLSLFGT